MKYELIGLVILTALAAVPFVLTLKLLFGILRRATMGKPLSRRLVYLTVGVDLLVIICAFDAWYVEPHALTITRISALSPKIAPQTGNLKIVHISDIHFEQNSPYIQRILSTIAAQKPDLIMVSGDNPQMRYFNRDQFFEFLRSLMRIAPIYMSPGYYEDTVDMLTSPVAKNYLQSGEHAGIAVRGTRIIIQGFGPTEPVDRPPGLKAKGALYLVLDHTPDAIDAISRLGADWCFVGHTHGGQFRLPFWGAVTTLCLTGKRCEYGHYRVGKTDFFVTRGLGLEPKPAPQVRFLCRPEIVVLTLKRGVPAEDGKR
jgi:predicted MPP superfamily phosphohydrolase